MWISVLIILCAVFAEGRERGSSAPKVGVDTAHIICFARKFESIVRQITRERVSISAKAKRL